VLTDVFSIGIAWKVSSERRDLRVGLSRRSRMSFGFIWSDWGSEVERKRTMLMSFISHDPKSSLSN
jgi:hypothetical protein